MTIKVSISVKYCVNICASFALFFLVEVQSLWDDSNLNASNVRIEFDCRPGAIAQSLALREPKYQETAAYCHFGREPVTKKLHLHLVSFSSYA